MKDAKKADAAEKKDDGKGSDKSAKKSGLANKKQLIIFLVIGLVFAGLMAGGALYLLKSLSGDDPEAALIDAENSTAQTPQGEQGSSGDGEENKKGEANGEAKPATVYIPLKPAFVVNFEDSGSQHFLQVDVTLMTREAQVEDVIKTHMPLIRNALVMLYGAQSIAVLETAEGKENLRQQSLVEVQNILMKETGKKGIEDVFFTSLVMQ